MVVSSLCRGAGQRLARTCGGPFRPTKTSVNSQNALNRKLVDTRCFSTTRDALASLQSDDQPHAMLFRDTRDTTHTRGKGFKRGTQMIHSMSGNNLSYGVLNEGGMSTLSPPSSQRDICSSSCSSRRRDLQRTSASNEGCFLHNGGKVSAMQYRRMSSRVTLSSLCPAPAPTTYPAAIPVIVQGSADLFSSSVMLIVGEGLDMDEEDDEDGR